MRSVLLAGIAVGVIGGCAMVRTQTTPMGAYEARYRLRGLKKRSKTAISTSVYRGLLAKSLFARCAMVPSDSEMFNARAQRCGALQAAIRGISRLYLERAASPVFLRPVRIDGRLRWIDLPGRSPCE